MGRRFSGRPLSFTLPSSIRLAAFRLWRNGRPSPPKLRGQKIKLSRKRQHVRRCLDATRNAAFRPDVEDESKFRLCALQRLRRRGAESRPLLQPSRRKFSDDNIWRDPDSLATHRVFRLRFRPVLRVKITPRLAMTLVRLYLIRAGRSGVCS